jgi:hypothetical protein
MLTEEQRRFEPVISKVAKLAFLSDPDIDAIMEDTENCSLNSFMLINMILIS